MNRIGFLHRAETLLYSPGALAGAPEGEEEEADGERDGVPAERGSCQIAGRAARW